MYSFLSSQDPGTAQGARSDTTQHHVTSPTRSLSEAYEDP
jgi:hypothetical protein